MSIFERATRLKLRFGTLKGGNSLMVEDLWDLPLTSTTGRVNLDDLAKAFNQQLKNDNVSFVNPDRKPDERVQVAFDVVVHVINTKMAENKQLMLEHDRIEKKRRIMQIIVDKQDETLRGKTLEELQKEFETL